MEVAVVVLLFAVGEMLENVAAGQARSGIKALADLMPGQPGSSGMAPWLSSRRTVLP